MVCVPFNFSCKIYICCCFLPQKIANLGWLQRRAAISIYGMSSSLSVDDALAWFEKAEELDSTFTNMNPFSIAKVTELM